MPSPDDLMRSHGLPEGFRQTFMEVCQPVALRIAGRGSQLGRPVVVGLCGSQGSGKSTLSAFLQVLLAEQGVRAAVLSLDDLYLPRGVRLRLAKEVHPLLATRGPPGSHDVQLGLSLLDDLIRPGVAHELSLPCFDKASDTRLAPRAWARVCAPVQVVLLEGWCVGARPQPAEALVAPINALERDEDPDGCWRRHVNECLAGDYQTLFSRIDLLIALQAPSFEQVFAWRALQERKLDARLSEQTHAVPGARRRRLMGPEALETFIMHFERLTRHMLEDMPTRADILIRLGPDHQVLDLEVRVLRTAGAAAR